MFVSIFSVFVPTIYFPPILGVYPFEEPWSLYTGAFLRWRLCVPCPQMCPCLHKHPPASIKRIRAISFLYNITSFGSSFIRNNRVSQLSRLSMCVKPKRHRYAIQQAAQLEAMLDASFYFFSWLFIPTASFARCWPRDNHRSYIRVVSFPSLPSSRQLTT